MEKQLAEYRARKEKERKSQQSWGEYLFGGSKNTSSTEETVTNQKQNPQTKNVSHIQNGEVVYHETEDEVEESSIWTYFTLRNILILILWLLLWKIFIELQFGAVFFLISGFAFIYFNTRTGPKNANKLSAYSVFNPNFERLEGTLTAEQFESELLRRPLNKD